jgi:hypothetical protein
MWDGERLHGSRTAAGIAACDVAPPRSQASALKKLIPLGDRVLVKRIVQEARTAGGILLPDTGKKLNEGEVRRRRVAALGIRLCRRRPMGMRRRTGCPNLGWASARVHVGACDSGPI